MTSEAAYYKPAGPVSLTAVGGLLVTSVLGMVAMAFVVAYATQYMGTKTSIVTGFIACALPGIGIAGLTRWFRLQYPAIIAIAALIAVFVGGYAYCVFRAAIMLDWLAFPLMPHDLLNAMQFLARHMVSVDLITGEARAVDEGTVSLFFALHGLMLAFVVFFNPLAAYMAVRWRPPYCHHCRRWMREPLHRLYSKRPAGVVHWSYQIEQGRLDALDALERTDDPSEAFRLDVHGCPTCGGAYYLDVWDQRREGGEQVKQRLVHGLVLTSEHVASLQALLDETHQPDGSPA